MLGDKSDLDKDVFNDLGIIHIFSLSGLHISLLVYLLKKIKCKNIIIYIFLLFFLFLTSFGISTVRASLSLVFKDINDKYKLDISSENRLIISYMIL